LQTRVLTAQQIVKEVERLLARPRGGAEALEAVAGLLQTNRRYSWVGIYVVAGEKMRRHAETSATPGSETAPAGIAAAIRTASRTLGMIEAQGAFSYEDQVLLKRVAALVAKFLTGPGKGLLRKAREEAAETAQAEKKLQPGSERMASAEGRSARTAAARA